MSYRNKTRQISQIFVERNHIYLISSLYNSLPIVCFSHLMVQRLQLKLIIKHITRTRTNMYANYLHGLDGRAFIPVSSVHMFSFSTYKTASEPADRGNGGQSLRLTTQLRLMSKICLSVCLMMLSVSRLHNVYDRLVNKFGAFGVMRIHRGNQSARRNLP
jgi:hypothetical protein